MIDDTEIERLVRQCIDRENTRNLSLSELEQQIRKLGKEELNQLLRNIMDIL